MDAKEIQEEEEFYSQFYPHLIRYQHQDQAKVQKTCVRARVRQMVVETLAFSVRHACLSMFTKSARNIFTFAPVYIQEHTLSRTYDPTEMSEMTERSINDQVC